MTISSELRASECASPKFPLGNHLLLSIVSCLTAVPIGLAKQPRLRLVSDAVESMLARQRSALEDWGLQRRLPRRPRNHQYFYRTGRAETRANRHRGALSPRRFLHDR